MGTAKSPLIGPDQAALLARPLSANAASRDAKHRPHLARVLGFRLAPGLDRVTVFLAAPSSAELLADLRANGQIAVVFSEPATHRTLQLKGSDAVVAPFEAADLAGLRAYWQAFGDAIAELGFTRGVAQTVLATPEGDLVAVHFTPQAGFDQTPGPRAGQALAPAAAG